MIQAVASSVRERVIVGEFPPGTQLREIELAQEYGVARPTIRAALQQLALTGLLRREANRSAFVPELSAEDVGDLYTARRLIETEVVHRLMKAETQLAGARQALSRLERFSEDASWSDVVEADLDFHRALTEAAGSPRLLRLFELLGDEIRLAIAQLRSTYASPADLAREHRRLLTVIEAGQPAEAIRLMQQHLDQAVSDLTKSR